jgi:hypothetical protein
MDTSRTRIAYRHSVTVVRQAEHPSAAADDDQHGALQMRWPDGSSRRDARRELQQSTVVEHALAYVLRDQDEALQKV